MVVVGIGIEREIEDMNVVDDLEIMVSDSRGLCKNKMTILQYTYLNTMGIVLYLDSSNCHVVVMCAAAALSLIRPCCGLAILFWQPYHIQLTSTILCSHPAP